MFPRKELMPIILGLRRKKYHNFEASLGYIVKLCLLKILYCLAWRCKPLIPALRKQKPVEL